MTPSYMKADVAGIGKLINERGYFRVPDHQRDYAWPVGAVEQYLEDVQTAMEGGDPEYFLGLIVLVEPTDPSKAWRILDGQQRLATTTMIYSAIRTFLVENGLKDDALKIEERYLGISELGESERTPRISLNVNNRDPFIRLVVDQVDDRTLDDEQRRTGRNSSTRKLIEALQSCRAFIFRYAHDAGTDTVIQANALFRLAQFLRDNVQVAVMDVSSSGNAYVIFESLNDRGIDLSVLDLVKNHIFGRAGTRLDEAQANWTKMVATLGDRKADDFLKVFWTSRYGRVQRGRLFANLKAKYATPKAAIELSAQLASAVEYYVSLDSTDSDVWADHTPASRKHMETLNRLGGLQVRPIIMAALQRFTPDRLERLLKHLVTLIVRYQTVGAGRTGKLEITCANAAPQLFAGTLKSPQKVWDQVRRIVPTDEEFKNDLLTYSEPDATRARYILRELENAHWRTEHPGKARELAPETDPSINTLEHILPKRPSPSWKSVLANDATILSDCLHRLGNLCLLTKGANKQSGNLSFKDKASKIYSKSELALTAEIPKQYKEWNRANIADRQLYLADLALAAWPLD